MKMKFSVVTISYNQNAYLKNAIDSIVEQRPVVDLQYIVVDAGSTDGSRELIKQYGDRIDKTVFESDKGPADGLNKGFQHALGDILCFINADDLLLPNSLLEVERVFERNPDIDVLLTSGFRIDGDGRVICRHIPSKCSASAYVHGAVTLFQQGMFFRPSALRQAGGFNVSNRTCWDGELLFDMMQSGARLKRAIIDTAAFRVYPSSITGSQRFANQYEADQLRIFHKWQGMNSNAPTTRGRISHRIVKLLSDPIYLYHRTIDAMSSSIRTTVY